MLDAESGEPPVSTRVELPRDQLGLLARGSRGLGTSRFGLPAPDRSEWLRRPNLSTYSGGTAPASHRLPFYAQIGQLTAFCSGKRLLHGDPRRPRSPPASTG